MPLGHFGGSTPHKDYPAGGGGAAGGSPGAVVEAARDAQQESPESYGGLRVAVGSFTRDTSVASGTQAVTGVGFRPSIAILVMSIESGAVINAMSHGLSNVTSDVAARWPNSTQTDFSTTKSISFVDVANSYEGELSSFDTDGFTVTWTKTGTPTAVIRIGYAALR